MRISAVPSDSGFPNYRVVGSTSILLFTLDGHIVVSPVVTADEEEGLIEMYVLDHHGDPVLENGLCVTRVARGRVQIFTQRRPH